MRDINTLIDNAKATGTWVFNGGLHAPSTATVVRTPPSLRAGSLIGRSFAALQVISSLSNRRDKASGSSKMDAQEPDFLRETNWLLEPHLPRNQAAGGRIVHRNQSCCLDTAVGRAFRPATGRTNASSRSAILRVPRQGSFPTHNSRHSRRHPDGGLRRVSG